MNTRLLPMMAAAGLASMSAFVGNPAVSMGTRCTMMPAASMLLLRVERDTTLPFTVAPQQITSFSMPGRGRVDSLLAQPGTPMPAARVRLLQVDDATRARLSADGVGAVTTAFIRAAPYGADCRTMRWTDTSAWTRAGEEGYARATLAPRDAWIDGVPVFVIAEAWAYQYPNRRVRPYGTTPTEPLTPAAAMFGLHTTMGRVMTSAAAVAPEQRAAMMRDSALAWARGNLAAAALPPARDELKRAILAPVLVEYERAPSRFRGSYRVTMESQGVRGTWYFRTHDRSGYSWRSADSARSIQDVVASPYPAGYQVVGFAATTPDSLLDVAPSGSAIRTVPLVWLAVGDRPGAPGNEERRTFPAELEFKLGAAPANLWDPLEQFIPPMSPMESEALARMNVVLGRHERQPRLALSLRRSADGGVSADTTLERNGARLRVTITRLDTVSMKRPF